MPEEKENPREISRWREYLREEKLGIRLLIALILLISFTLFIHFREVRIEFLQLNTQAKNYVVAEVDFEFPDKNGTIVLLQQALKDVGSIYMFAPRKVKQVRYDFEDMLIHRDVWREELPTVTFEEMYLGADDIQHFLMSARFTDARTLKKIESLHISTENYFIAKVGKDGAIYLPDQFWTEAKDKLMLKKKITPGAAEFITAYFREVEWNFINDTAAQKQVRTAIEEVIPQKYSRVQAGTQLITKGETISESHISKIQAMKKAISENRNLLSPLTILGSILYATIIMCIGALYFKVFHRDFFFSAQRLALFATIVILTLALGKVIEYFLIVNTNIIVESVRYPIIIPFAAILLCVLLNAEIALFTSTVLTVVMILSLAVDHNKVIIVNFFAAIITILVARTLRKRKEVFAVCGKVWIAIIPVFFVFIFGQNLFWSRGITADLFSSFLFLLLTAILVVGLLPMLESFFGVMTDITLMEYMDPNNELLRRLSIEAPGTYQHSLVVGSIAESAALSINANGLFCRVATLYHDIGKLFNPHYFTENQMGGFNIHQLLTPIESTQVIIAHVTEGEALARKHGLPQNFIDIILQHHGTTLVYYFYCKQVEQMGGDVDAVDEMQFRYPGPRPKTKESAIIMIADTIEAASRSLEEVNEETIEELVERLVADKAEEGQFDECQLTFEELQTVKRTIIKTLSVTRHLRVKYPERK